MIEETYYDEYESAATTERLHIGAIVASAADQLLPARPAPLIAALLFIVAGAIKLGWELRGLWGPIYDNRGWGALVVFSIVGSVYMVNYCNHHTGE